MPNIMISIHAPRAGSDGGLTIKICNTYKISIHAPRAGSDFMYDEDYKAAEHFNPRSPCGERRYRIM